MTTTTPVRVQLLSYDPEKKIQAIKALRTVDSEALTLKRAKDIVDDMGVFTGSHYSVDNPLTVVSWNPYDITLRSDRPTSWSLDALEAGHFTWRVIDSNSDLNRINNTAREIGFSGDVLAAQYAKRAQALLAAAGQVQAAVTAQDQELQ